MSKMCTKCGAILNPVAKVCYSCGAPVEESSTSSSTEFFGMEDAKPYEEIKPATSSTETSQSYTASSYTQNTYNRQSDYSSSYSQQASANTPQDSYNPTGYQAGNFSNPALLEDKKPMVIFFVLTAIAILIGVILLFNSNGLGMSKESKEMVAPLQNVLDGVVENDYDKLMSAYPPAIKKVIEEELAEYGYSSQDYLDMFDGVFSPYGVSKSKISFSIKLKSKEKLDSSGISKMENNVKNYYDLSITIEEAYDLNIDIVTKYDGKTGYENTDYVVVKIDGEWYLGDFFQ